MTYRLFFCTNSVLPLLGKESPSILLSITELYPIILKLKVMAALEALSEQEDEVLAFQENLEKEGTASLEGFEVTKGMCSWKKGTKKISEIKFTPSVIEPSFGET